MPPPPPPPPNPPNPPPAPTYALPVTILSPLPLPVVGQQPGPGPGPLPSPPSPTPTPVPLAVGTLPAVPVNLVQVAAPVPVFVLGGKLDTPAVPPLQPRPAGRLPRPGDSTQAAIRGIGGALSSIAALSSRGLLDSLNALIDKVPVVGGAVAEFNRQLLAFTDGITATANRLAAYSPQLAIAQAQIEVGSLLADVRRAQQLGSGLTRFEAARQTLSQTAQDAMADALEKLLPIVTDILQIITYNINQLRDLPSNTYNFFVDAINAIIDALNNVAQKITFGTAAIIPHVRAIRQNTDPRPDLPAAPFLDELLGFGLPSAGLTPPRAPGFVGG